MNKILSIIIPTYNMEALLRHTLDSLIVSDGNMSILEVLVINDGSKDNSLEIAREYASKYPQTFNAVDKPNGNYGSCINKGLELATGKYIKILDADDCYNPDVLDNYLSYLSTCKSDMVITDFDIVDSNWITESEFNFKLPTEASFTLKTIPEELIDSLWHQGITFNRNVFNGLNYRQTEGISYTDDEWVTKPMLNVENITYYPHILYNYLRGREGQTFDPKVVKRTLEHRLIVAKSLSHFYQDNYGKMSEDSLWFIGTKIRERLHGVYSFHLTRYASSENNKNIKEFDLYIKEHTPDAYKLVNNKKNKLGFKYISDWRNSNYSMLTFSLLATRFIRFMQILLKGNTVAAAKLPKQLKRK